MGTLAHKLATALEVRRTYRNWPRWFLSHYQIPSSAPDIEIQVRGATFRASNHTESWGIADQVWRERVYTRHFPILDGYRVLDVGAHFGFFSIFAACQGLRVSIVAYEPARESFAFLQWNVERNGRTRQIRAVNAGLSDAAGNLTLYKQKHHHASSTLFQENLPQPLSAEEEEEVRVEAAAHVWAACQRYEFAKFDCEGAEYPIFRALGEDLSRFRYVVVEYHRDPAELKEILAGRRFAIVEDLPLKVAPWSAFPSMGILYARNLGNWE